MAKEEGKAMVWSDKTGTYKLGYSQYLQMKTLKVETLLLICVIVLIIMIIVGAFYAQGLIQRIDDLNVFSRMAGLIYSFI